MPSIQVKVDDTKLTEVADLLSGIPGGLEKAIIGACNDTAKKTKVQISNAIRAKVNIKKKDIDGRIQIVRANSTRGATVTLSESERLSLVYFGARPYKARRLGKRKLHDLTRDQVQQLTGGLTYKINKADARKRVPGGFIGTARLGGHAFKRVGKKRLPIQKLKGPSPWGVFVKSGLENKTVIDAEAELNKQLDRRVKFLLLKQSGEIK